MAKSNYLEKLVEQGNAVWQGLRLVRSDNWQNVFTGLGTARDKTQYGKFVSLSDIPDHELTGLYHQNDTAKRIVNLKPQEMLRQGYTINVRDDTEATSAIGQRLRDLHANTRLVDAMIWGRLYGGSAIIMGADDGRAANEPLDENAIRSIRFLHVVDRRSLQPATYYKDPLNDEFFGQPELYHVIPLDGSASNMTIHRSRMLLFGGAHTSAEEKLRLGGWDHSILTAIYGALRQFDNVWQASEQLMSDASQAVFKVQGLMSMIAGGQKDVLQTRMQLVDMSRSVARALLLDAEGGEEFERTSSNFTDAQNMLDKFMLRLASAAEMPVTILMGRSPAGENATGESDFRAWYDTIRTAQENDLEPRLSRLVTLLMLSKDGPTGGIVPETWEIRFDPLWQATPEEQATIEKITAEKDKIYLETGVLLPEEVALSRFRSEGWNAETQIDRNVRETLLEIELETLADPEEEPPPVEEPEEEPPPPPVEEPDPV